MTTLEKIRNEFIDRYPRNYAGELELGGRSCVFSLNEVLQILDKYAEQEPTDEWQNGYDMAWELAEVFYEKEEPTSPCDLCRFDYMDGVCGDCPAMAKAEWERERR